MSIKVMNGIKCPSLIVGQLEVGNTEIIHQNFGEKIQYARDYTKDLLKRIWPYVLIGIGVGGFIHGYVPSDFLVKYAGPGNPFAVPVAVLIGVPLYSNAAGTIPHCPGPHEEGVAYRHSAGFYDGCDRTLFS